jgi:hypothetical protein
MASSSLNTSEVSFIEGTLVSQAVCEYSKGNFIIRSPDATRVMVLMESKEEEVRLLERRNMSQGTWSKFPWHPTLLTINNTTPFAVMMHRILHVLIRNTADTHDILIRSASSVLRLHVNNSMMSRK